NRDIFLIELPHISTKLYHKVPSGIQIVQEIESILHSNGYSKGIFCGHSFGTIVCSWIIKKKPEIIHSSILIDPTCFLIHEPQVTFNFLYRTPTRWNQWLLYYFASKEMGIS